MPEYERQSIAGMVLCLAARVTCGSLGLAFRKTPPPRGLREAPPLREALVFG